MANNFHRVAAPLLASGVAPYALRRARRIAHIFFYRGVITAIRQHGVCSTSRARVARRACWHSISGARVCRGKYLSRHAWHHLDDMA